jgi:hypothetical protein
MHKFFIFVQKATFLRVLEENFRPLEVVFMFYLNRESAPTVVRSADWIVGRVCLPICTAKVLHVFNTPKDSEKSPPVRVVFFMAAFVCIPNADKLFGRMAKQKKRSRLLLQRETVVKFCRIIPLQTASNEQPVQNSHSTKYPIGDDLRQMIPHRLSLERCWWFVTSLTIAT